MPEHWIAKDPGVAESKSPHTLIPRKIPATVAAGAGDRDHWHQVSPRGALADAPRLRFVRRLSRRWGAAVVTLDLEATAKGLNPGKSRGGRTNCRGSKPTVQLRPTRLRSPNKAPVPDRRPYGRNRTEPPRRIFTPEPQNYGWDRSHFCFRSWGSRSGSERSPSRPPRDLSAAHNGWPSTRPGRVPARRSPSGRPPAASRARRRAPARSAEAVATAERWTISPVASSHLGRRYQIWRRRCSCGAPQPARRVQSRDTRLRLPLRGLCLGHTPRPRPNLTAGVQHDPVLRDGRNRRTPIERLPHRRPGTVRSAASIRHRARRKVWGTPTSLQLLLVMLGALVARRALKGGVQPVAAIVDRPDRELVRDGACFHR